MYIYMCACMYVCMYPPLTCIDERIVELKCGEGSSIACLRFIEKCNSEFVIKPLHTPINSMSYLGQRESEANRRGK